MARTSILGNVAVKLGMISSGFNKDIRKAELSLKRFGKNMKSIGQSMTIGISAPLSALAITSVKAFDKQAKAVAQLEQGLKSTGNAAGFTSQELQKMASALQNNSLFGDEDIIANVTSQLLTFTNISGTAFSRTQQAALDLATRLDGDLKSASIQLGKALNDPVANLSALSRSGIQFSKEQKETIKSLVETNRLADAQAIILDELEKQYGGSAKAASDAGLGGFTQLQNAFGDLLETVGEQLMPILNEVTAYLRGVVERLQGLALNIDRDVAQKFVKLAGIVAVGGPLLMGLGALLSVLAAIGIPALAVAAAVGGLAAAILYLLDNLPAFEAMMINTFRNVARDVLNSIQKMILGIMEFSGIAGKNLGAGALAAVGQLKSELPDEQDAIPFGTFSDAIMNAVSTMVGGLDLFITKVKQAKNESASIQQKRQKEEQINDPLAPDMSKLQKVKVYREVWAELSNFQIAQAQAIGRAFDSVADSFARAFVDGVTDIKNFADAFKALGQSIVSALREVAVQLVKMAALRGIAKLFGLGSVTTAFDVGAGVFNRLFGTKVKQDVTPGAAGAGKMALQNQLFIDGRQIDFNQRLVNRQNTRIFG